MHQKLLDLLGIDSRHLLNFGKFNEMLLLLVKNQIEQSDDPNFPSEQGEMLGQELILA